MQTNGYALSPEARSFGPVVFRYINTHSLFFFHYASKYFETTPLVDVLQCGDGTSFECKTAVPWMAFSHKSRKNHLFKAL